MKRIAMTAAIATVALTSASYLFADDAGKTMSAEQQCRAEAKKAHVAKDDMDAYLKSCIEKQGKTSN